MSRKLSRTFKNSVVTRRLYASVEGTRSAFFAAARRVGRTREIHYLGIFRKGAPQSMIGLVACCADRERHPRAGYFIASPERRKGYATEAFKGTMAAMMRGSDPSPLAYEEVLAENRGGIKMLIAAGLRPLGLRTTALPQKTKHRALALQGSLKP